ncbi:hypothetical protein EMCRGX_G009763 [Ephydatia muelleri]
MTSRYIPTATSIEIPLRDTDEVIELDGATSYFALHYSKQGKYDYFVSVLETSRTAVAKRQKLLKMETKSSTSPHTSYMPAEDNKL